MCHNKFFGFLIRAHCHRRHRLLTKFLEENVIISNTGPEGADAEMLLVRTYSVGFNNGYN